MNRLGEVIGRPEPTMATTLMDTPLEADLLNMLNITDVVEFRADQYPSFDDEDLRAEISVVGTAPLLFTLRSSEEGGAWTGNDSQRLEIIEGVLPSVDGIDIELEAAIAPDVIQAAHDMGKVVVLSNHDFTGTPSRGELEKRLGKANEYEPDFVKFAVTDNTLEDYQRLVRFTLDNSGKNLITIGMGNRSAISRICLLSIGSNLTYASMSQETAISGQLDYIETSRYISALYPDYPVMAA